MNSFPHLPQPERALICEQAEARLGRAPRSVEKDFWVCWTLDRLFKLPEWGGHLTFKGGTGKIYTTVGGTLKIAAAVLA